ncbi:hypothetical protein N8Y41_01830 [bacterium]|nr:hypothetical protein [bacterium]
MSLKQLAIDTLAKNDRGGFTIPTAGLYPYQWNWDSAFVALGIATYDMDRAWSEITKLIDGQWPDGMIPSIIFRSDDPSYFPGPSRWGKNLALSRRLAFLSRPFWPQWYGKLRTTAKALRVARKCLTKFLPGTNGITTTEQRTASWPPCIRGKRGEIIALNGILDWMR